MLRLRWLALVAAVTVGLTAILGCNKGNERQVENELQAWDLPIADVPEVLPGRLNTVFEDRDGRVWLGTANGVVRYDTSGSWRVFSSFDGLPLESVEVIHQDRRGTLWFALREGKLVAHDLNQSTWQSYDIPNDRFVDPRQIIEGPENGFWLFGFDGVTRLSHPKGSRSPNLARLKGNCGKRSEVVLDSTGSFWTYHETDLGDKWFVLRCDRDWNRTDSFPLPERISEIFQDQAGTLWIGTVKGLFSIRPGARQVEPASIPPEQVLSIAEDQKGGIWIGTEEGAWRRSPASTGWIKVEARDDSLGQVLRIKPGHGAEVWLLGSNGLFQAEASDLPIAVATIKAPSLFFYLILVKDRPWIWGYHATSIAGKSQARNMIIQGFPGSWNPLIKADSTGDVWAAPDGIIHRLDQTSGHWTPFPVLASLDFQRAENQFGSLWGSSGRLFGYRPDQGQWVVGNEPLFYDVSFHEDAHGRLWTATKRTAADSVLERCDWQNRACTAVELNPNPGGIRAIAESPPGILWFGGENGLARHDPETGKTRLFLPPSRDNLRRSSNNRSGPISALEPVNQNQLWLSTPNTLWRFTLNEEKWEHFDLPGSFVALREDPSTRNRLWLLGEDDSLTVFSPGAKSHRLSPEDLQISNSLRGVSLPDPSGAIWRASGGSVARQAWSSEGIPLRQEPFPFTGRERGLVTVSPYDKNTFVTWRTRPTGLQLTSDTGEARPLDLENGFPISALVAAPNGRAWLGQTMGGLMLWSRDGSVRRFGTEEGLPHATILDISQNPEADAPDAWVATNDGAARVDEKGVRKASPLPAGPVDAILALPEGGAWLALNSLPAGLFLAPPAAASVRSKAFLQRAAADGTVLRLNVPIPRGEVLDMALDPDGETVWIGTTAGLYRLRDNQATRITGRLQSAPFRRLAVDPEGTVWLGSDGSEDVVASVIGYDPHTQESRTFESGLPEADRIDSLSFTPDGDLVVLAGGKLVKGRVFVPSGIGATTVILGVILALLLGSGTTYAFARAGSRRAETEKFRPLLEAAHDFFTAAGQAPRRQDGRTLLLDRDGGSSVPVRCLDGDLVRVEEVMAAFRALPKSADEGGVALGYLVYSREVDPAAWRQLDVYRLRENVVLIPVSLAFLRAKTAQGSARSALEDLRRRYLGRQDLFDVRNALDETRFFFGRRSLVDEMFDTLSRREHAGLIGQRKSGKTSLLNFLAQRLDAFPVIVFDFQILQRDDPAWPAHLLGQIVDSYDKWGQARLGESWAPPSREAVMSGPAFRTALKERQALREKFGDHQPLVVLFDEIERVLPPLSGVDADRRRDQAERFVTATAVLRALGQQGGERLLAMVVADRLPVFNRINSFGLEGVDTNPFYRFFREFFLRPLDPEECREMLVEIGAAMGLQMSPDLCERLYEDSGGAPALARQLASAAVQKSEGAALLTLEHYEEGLRSLREESGEVDSFFKENYWKPLRPAERRVLKLAALADGGSDLEAPGPAKDAEGADIPERLELVEARRTLLATGMLEETATGHQVRGGLFRAWLAENLQWLEEDSSPR